MGFLGRPLLASEDLVVVDNGEWAVKGEGDLRRFDLGVYPSDVSTSSKITETEACANRLPNTHQVSWESVVVPIEVKWADGNNAFGPLPGNFLTTTVDGKESRGQITEYAAKIMATQHRTCLFSIFIHRFTARLLRWDRVGVVVSKPIHYKDNPTPLIAFLYRFGQMTLEERGIDPTVTSPTPAEKAQLDDFEPDNKSHQQLRDGCMARGCPIETIFKVEVMDESLPSGKRYLLVSKPQEASESFTGRGTKGFVAYDLEGKRLVWLKDCWRVDSEGSKVPVHPEHETYAKLKSHNVQFVATAICGGDVKSHSRSETPGTEASGPLGPIPQKTLNQQWVVDFRPKIHYRLVLKEIGRELETYSDSSFELCDFVFHAYLGRLFLKFRGLVLTLSSRTQGRMGKGKSPPSGHQPRKHPH